MRMSRSLIFVVSLLSLALPVQADEPQVDFNRDIRPILSDTCFVCHGPDSAARTTDLRFDLKDVATSELESGVTAIVPGKPDESEMIARITSDDDSLRMPPADFKRQLKPRRDRTHQGMGGARCGVQAALVVHSAGPSNAACWSQTWRGSKTRSTNSF